MEVFVLWLFTRADSIQNTFNFWSFLSTPCVLIIIICKAILAVSYAECHHDMSGWKDDLINKAVTKFQHWFIFLAIFSTLGYLITPNKKDIAIIAGGYVLVEASKSSVVTETAKKLNELIQGELDEALNEMKKKKEKKEK